MNKSLFSSKKMDYCTPQRFFDELNAEFDFVLDAAATNSSAKCRNFYTPESDGLNNPWDIYGGAVFCNPPYGKAIGKWVQKAHEEAQKGTTIVLLLPARTDTRYFHDYIYGHAAVRFLKGRIHFTDEEGKEYPPAPFPSMLVIYNGKNENRDQKKNNTKEEKAMEEIKGMTAEREMRILERAIEKFGAEAQIIKAIEELGELSVELARDLNEIPGRLDALKEELADAFIMLNQLEMIFGDVSDVEIRKLERLERMVEDK